MPPEEQQGQGQDAPEASSEPKPQANTGQSNQGASPQTPQNASGDDGARGVMIPKARFDEESSKRKEAERELQRMQAEQEQAQEERAQKQGEYQQLADKRKKDLDREKAAHAETKHQWQRERRLNTWNTAVQGIIKPGKAIETAFNLLGDEELSGVDETDEQAFRQLAQNLAEVHDYLAVDGPRGAGSGGSSQPVLNGKAMAGGREPLFADAKRKRRPWK